MSDENKKAYAAGQEAGRVAQILVEHSKHFDTINGSIAKTADALRDVVGEVRAVREDMRLAANRVEIAADVLAKETERRRVALADAVDAQDRRTAAKGGLIARRERWVGLAISAVALALGYWLGH